MTNTPISTPAAEAADAPEALRLAECLERDCKMNWPDYDNQMAAAAELRRLHAIATAGAAAAPAASPNLPLAITSAPQRIWLDLGFDPWEEDAHFSNLHELTWSSDNATGDGIEYVRADLVALAAQPSPPSGAADPVTVMSEYIGLCKKEGMPDEKGNAILAAVRDAVDLGYFLAAPSGEVAAPATHPLVNDSFAVDWLTNRAELHPLTASLVVRFARALASKLAAAEKKYGYSDGWNSPDWMAECRQKLVEHVAKGDPRDVAAYCAFLWHHGASTAAEGEGEVAAEPALTDAKPRSAAWGQLYTAANALVARVGHAGEIGARTVEVESLQNALAGLDGGQWMPGLEPAAK